MSSRFHAAELNLVSVLFLKQVPLYRKKTYLSLLTHHIHGSCFLFLIHWHNLVDIWQIQKRLLWLIDILLKNTDVFVSQKIVSIQFCSQQSAVLRVSDIMSLPEQPRHLARGVRKRRAGVEALLKNAMAYPALSYIRDRTRCCIFRTVLYWDTYYFSLTK